MFYRPAFDNLFYTYLPTHVTRPKECKKVFVVPLPDKAMFAVSSAAYTLHLHVCFLGLWAVSRGSSMCAQRTWQVIDIARVFLLLGTHVSAGATQLPTRSRAIVRDLRQHGEVRGTRV